MVKIMEAPLEENRFAGSSMEDFSLDDVRSVSEIYNEDYRQSDLNITAVRDVCCCCSCCPCCSCCAVSNVDPFESKIW